MPPPLRLGLTGGIGSGKTTVANLFAQRGVPLIDTDLIAHALTGVDGGAMAAIQAQFGIHFIGPDGAMDRKKMREHAFTHPEARQALEAILHPLIRQECERQAQETKAPYLIFVVPLLFEAGDWEKRIVRSIVVDCKEQTQIQRVMTRNGLSQADIERIMQAQISRVERLKRADDIVNSELDLSQVAAQVEQLHQKYLYLAGLCAN